MQIIQYISHDPFLCWIRDVRPGWLLGVQWLRPVTITPVVIGGRTCILKRSELTVKMTLMFSHVHNIFFTRTLLAN
jgi:hypothetical protein